MQRIDGQKIGRDDELLGKYVREACQDSFRVLVDRYAGLVLGTCQRVLKDRTAAEDASQQVFLEFAKKAHSLAERHCLAGWFYQTSRFKALSGLRSQLAREKITKRYQDCEVISRNGSGEIGELLEDEMVRLDSTDRELLLLKYYIGHSVEEAAAALGFSKAAGQKRIQRALKKLAEQLTLSRKTVIPVAAISGALEAGAQAFMTPALAKQWTASVMNSGGGKSAATIMTSHSFLALMKTHFITASLLVVAGAFSGYQAKSNAWFDAAKRPRAELPVAEQVVDRNDLSRGSKTVSVSQKGFPETSNPDLKAVFRKLEEYEQMAGFIEQEGVFTEMMQSMGGDSLEAMKSSLPLSEEKLAAVKAAFDDYYMGGEIFYRCAIHAVEDLKSTSEGREALASDLAKESGISAVKAFLIAHISAGSYPKHLRQSFLKANEENAHRLVIEQEMDPLLNEEFAQLLVLKEIDGFQDFLEEYRFRENEKNATLRLNRWSLRVELSDEQRDFLFRSLLENPRCGVDGFTGILTMEQIKTLQE